MVRKDWATDMRCRNIARGDGDHSLYLNPNGICNKCQMVKDEFITKQKRRTNEKKHIPR